MIGSETLEAMIAAGLTGEQMLAIVRGMEADAKPKDRTAAERQQRHRDKLKAERDGVTRDVTRDDVTNIPFPAPAPSFPPDPQTNPTPTHTPGETSRARKGRSDGGKRLPDDWKPTRLARDTVSGGIVENRGQEWATRALESFKNHWRSANGPNARKLDWQAAFANWIIEQDNRDGRSNTMGGNRGQGAGEARILAAGRAFVTAGAPPH